MVILTTYLFLRCADGGEKSRSLEEGGKALKVWRQVGCFFLLALLCARGKFMEGPGPGLSGDGLVEAAGKLALASGRCRRGCDAAILCAPPLAACQFFLRPLALLFYRFYLFFFFF